MESLEHFARPEILEGDYGGNRNYSNNSGYRDLVFLGEILDVLGEIDASLSRFFSLATERTRRAVSLQFSV